jgi:hypothetical protein
VWENKQFILHRPFQAANGSKIKVEKSWFLQALQNSPQKVNCLRSIYTEQESDKAQPLINRNLFIKLNEVYI